MKFDIFTVNGEDKKNDLLNEPVEDESPFFDVVIIDYPATVEIGDEMTIQIEVTNTGDETGEAYIDLFIDNTDSYVDDERINLAPGESQIVELNYIIKESDEPEIEAIVKPLNITTNEYDSVDSAWIDIDVLEQTPHFEVKIIDYPGTPVVVGEEMSFEVEVSNTGYSGEQSILFSFGDDFVDLNENIYLSANSSAVYEFNYTSVEDDIGGNRVLAASYENGNVINSYELNEQIEVVEAFVDAEIINFGISEDKSIGDTIYMGVTIKNTGNIKHAFIAGASIWEPGTSSINMDTTYEDFEKEITLEPGDEDVVVWSTSVNKAGNWAYQYGAWEQKPYIADNLLDKKPSPVEYFYVED